MNAKLFINYRREDTRHAAGRLYDRLVQRFGNDHVFMDIDHIEPGEDFVEVVNRKVGTCDVAIVAIGHHWLGATDDSGKRRLDDEEDFVRMEIAAALQRNIRVIPVLVDGARMPRKEDLPEALAPLCRRNAIELSETRFHADVNRLIEAIERSLSVLRKKEELSAALAAPPPLPAELSAAPPPVPAAVRPLEAESNVLPEPSESTKLAEAGEPKEIDGDATSGAAPVSVGETTPQFVAPLKELVVWRRKRPIIVPAIVSTVILLLAIAAGLTRLYQKAAAQRDADAQNHLGYLYEHGEGVDPDLDKARELYQKAANQGNVQAQYNLGVCYENGLGVEPDLPKAAKYYQEAADQGSQDAQDAIANLKQAVQDR